MIRLAIVEPRHVHPHHVSRLAFDEMKVETELFELDRWRAEGMTSERDVAIFEHSPAELNAIETLEDHRERGSKLPVMLVAATPSDSFLVNALDAGADDALFLPVTSSELQARVRALARRIAKTAPKLVMLGPLTLDVKGRSLFVGNLQVALTAREMALLEVFAERPGRLVNKDQLIGRLTRQGDLDITKNALEVYVHRLRRKLERHSVRIGTVRSIGYYIENAGYQVPA